VANNILIENDIGIGARESGGLTIVHNLILGSRKAGISFTIDRTRGGGWSAVRNYVYNNLFIGGAGLYQDVTAPDDIRSGDRRLDYNVYTMAADERRLVVAKSAPLTLAEWQERWKTYNQGANADAHSRAIAGNAYAFDPAAMELALTIAFDPTTVGTFAEPRLQTDFTGRPLPSVNPLPGALQTLRQGANRVTLWKTFPPSAR
jgi:hypothetical protein